MHESLEIQVTAGEGPVDRWKEEKSKNKDQDKNSPKKEKAKTNQTVIQMPRATEQAAHQVLPKR